MEEDWNIVLSILESPDNSMIGMQKVFSTSPITIGRAEDNDFIVNDPMVSRLHTTLRITNDYSRVFITDSSTHGTIVSDKTVPKGIGSGFTVHDGDSIKIGSTLIRFELKLKQSVQSTFIGKVDKDFLDTPPEEKQSTVEEDLGIQEVTSATSELKKQFSPFYIGVIIVSILILVYLIFFQ